MRILIFANRTSSNFSGGLNFANFAKIREINPIKVEFSQKPPSKHTAINAKCTPEEEKFIGIEIELLLKKGAIKETFLTDPFYTKSEWLILSLKQLNKFIKFNNLVTRDCFMASIDLKDAYYSIKIDFASAYYSPRGNPP